MPSILLSWLQPGSDASDNPADFGNVTGYLGRPLASVKPSRATIKQRGRVEERGNRT